MTFAAAERRPAARRNAALHPTADDTRQLGQLRQIKLVGHNVDYRLIRARRRSIGMEVHLEGLTVRAPRWVTIRDIELALSPRGEYEITDYVSTLARQQPCHVVEAKFWFPIGTEEAWKRAEQQDLETVLRGR